MTMGHCLAGHALERPARQLTLNSHPGRGTHNPVDLLVAGGSGGGGNALASAELDSPAIGTWSVTGSMTTGRVGQSATLLNNGQVLMAGASGSGTSARDWPARPEPRCHGLRMAARGQLRYAVW
jgi:hypothetical protein